VHPLAAGRGRLASAAVRQRERRGRSRGRGAAAAVEGAHRSGASTGRAVDAHEVVEVVEVVEVHGIAHGGDGVGRLADGRAVFVAGALPGEAVEVVVTRLHKRHAEAALRRVVRPSPHRVEPPCPYYGRCGGCQLQHAAPAHQLELKTRVVREQLQRIGRVPDPPVRAAVAPEGGWPGGYRTWARMAVDAEGRLGFRRARSHEVQPVDRCLLLTDGAQALRDAAGDGWDGADEVVLLAGAPADGDPEALGVVRVRAAAGRDPHVAEGPFGVVVDGPAGGRVVRAPDAVVLPAGGARLRTTAGSFTQSGPAAAALLADVVVRVLGAGPGDRVLELYGGGGLLGAAVARAGAAVRLVEGDPVAVADARANTAGLDVEVVEGDVAQVLRHVDAGEVDLVVLDPPRSGAGPQVCARLAELAPRRIAYVACDPAALARDVAALGALGWALASVDVLDLFGHTAHVECVAVLVPAPAGDAAT
jgi:tRNA/tmRNA/rRNA uracil-C5-methylase (TrmA/RlmC/RlmD family)